MPVSKKRKAELSDLVIKKFKGDVPYYWHELHGPEKKFNDLVKDSDCGEDKSPDAKYFVIQPIINQLIEEGVLQRKQHLHDKPFINLTDKGNAMYEYLNERGYVTKYKQENRKRNWTILLGFVSIATFILVCIRFYLEIISPNK